MTTSAFLIAASRTREHDWVLLPTFISPNERGLVMQQLPSRVNPETQIVEVMCGNKQFWVAIRIEYTKDNSGQTLLDHAGRELRYSYGVVSDKPITSGAANTAVDRVLPKIKESLANFLELPASSKRIRPISDVSAGVGSSRVAEQGEPTTMRTSIFVMGFVAGLAIILSLASILYGIQMSRTLAELSKKVEAAEKRVDAIETLPELSKRMEAAEKKVEAIEAKLRNPVPADGANPQH
jgi:hypothetical protein